MKKTIVILMTLIFTLQFIVVPFGYGANGTEEIVAPDISATIAPTIPQIAVIYGDVNSDCKVDSGDYTLMRRFLLGMYQLPSTTGINKNADLNCDGKIDSADYTILRKYLLGQIDKLPYNINPTATLSPTPTSKVIDVVEGDYFRISKSEGGLNQVRWSYKIENPDIVQFVESYVSQYPPVGSYDFPSQVNYKFKGLKEGKTEITFLGNTRLYESVGYTEKYIINVTAKPTQTIPEKWSFEKDKYVFVERFATKVGEENIEPTDWRYNFDKATGKLIVKYEEFDVCDDLKAVVGTMNSKGYFMSSFYMVGLYNLDEESDIRFDADGTVYFDCDGENIKLKLGESYTKERVEKTVYGKNEVFNIRFTNYGVFNKSDITLFHETPLPTSTPTPYPTVTNTPTSIITPSAYPTDKIKRIDPFFPYNQKLEVLLTEEGEYTCEIGNPGILEFYSKEKIVENNLVTYKYIFNGIREGQTSLKIYQDGKLKADYLVIVYHQYESPTPTKKLTNTPTPKPQITLDEKKINIGETFDVRYMEGGYIPTYHDYTYTISNPSILVLSDYKYVSGPTSFTTLTFKAIAEGTSTLIFEENGAKCFGYNVTVSNTLVPTFTPTPTYKPTPTAVIAEWNIDKDKYVFVEKYTTEIGEGDLGPLIGIDFPMYSFNSSKGTLNRVSKFFDVNDDLKAVIGEGGSLGGTRGYGVSTYLVGLYNLNEVKGMKFDADGTVYFDYNGESIKLKLGESCTKEKVEIVEPTDSYTGGKITVTTRFTNYGIFSKANIT